MKWLRRNAPTPVEFTTQQEQLQALSGDLLRKYRKDVDTEVSDPERLAEVYGTQFASGGNLAQAQTVVTMASQMLKTPHAMVNIILPDRLITVAAIGAETGDTPIEESWCQHVIGTGREFAVDDAETHPLVCDTQAARNGQVVSYLGVPIANLKGIIIGVLCVYDSQPRQWTPVDVGMLIQLAFVLTRATAGS